MAQLNRSNSDDSPPTGFTSPTNPVNNTATELDDNVPTGMERQLDDDHTTTNPEGNDNGFIEEDPQRESNELKRPDAPCGDPTVSPNCPADEPVAKQPRIADDTVLPEEDDAIIEPETKSSSLEDQQVGNDDTDPLFGSDMQVDDEEKLEDTFKFQWKMPDYAGIVSSMKTASGDQRKIHSPSFRHPNGDLWRLLIFPIGNKTSEATPTDLAVYLEIGEEPAVNDPAPSSPIGPKNKASSETNGTGEQGEDKAEKPTTSKPARRYRSVEFSIAMVNILNPLHTKRTSVAHEFSPDSKDWGFKTFMNIDTLLNPEEGFLTNEGELLFEVSITPTPEYRNLYYDSKSETGMVGLRNLGATCYLNSLLQTLFHTREFRHAVYKLDTSNDAENDGVALELQRLFWNMQTSSESVGTRQLTKAFGWTNFQCFTQHDVQELNRELCDKLEERMKGTELQGTVGRLFKGTYKSFIKCINVEYESSRIEDYYDIQLDIKGMKDVEESFAKYVETERLDGENQYDAAEFGKQDADKGVGFLSFPPVLHLHLKRFEYNMYTDNTVKINDRYEFPTTLNLNKYLYRDPKVEDHQSDENFDYVLHSVLVHSGDIHCGHYYAYISIDDAWYKFDDETVTKVSKSTAVDNTFGGEFPQQRGTNRERNPLYMRWANAYMLVYIRKSHLDSIMKAISDECVPRQLVDRFRTERLDRLQREQDMKESHLYQMLNVATMRDLEEFVDYRVRGKRRVMDFSNYRHEVKVLKEAPVRDIYTEVAKQLGLDESHFRLWVCSSRENETIRPDVILDKEANVSVTQFAAEQPSEPVIFLWVEEHESSSIQENQTIGNESSPAPVLARLSESVSFPDVEDKFLLFLRFFDSKEPDMEMKLKHKCHLFLSPNDVMGDLVEMMKEKVGLSSDETVDLLELIALDRVEPLALDKKLRKQDLSNGDIIIIQRAVQTDPESNHQAELRPRSIETDVISWMSYRQNRVKVQFVPLSEPNDDGFIMELRKDMTPNVLFPRFAEHCPGSPDPTHVRFTQPDYSTNEPKAAPHMFTMAYKRPKPESQIPVFKCLLQHSVLYNFDEDPPFKLYYEVLPWPVSLLDTHRILKLDVLLKPDNRKPMNEEGIAKCRELFPHATATGSNRSKTGTSPGEKDVATKVQKGSKDVRWGIYTNMETVTIAAPQEGTLEDVCELVLNELESKDLVAKGAKLLLHQVHNNRYKKPMDPDCGVMEFPRQCHYSRSSSGPCVVGEIEYPAALKEPQQVNVKETRKQEEQLGDEQRGGDTQPADTSAKVVSEPSVTNQVPEDGTCDTKTNGEPNNVAAKENLSANGTETEACSTTPAVDSNPDMPDSDCAADGSESDTFDEERFVAVTHFSSRADYYFPMTFGFPCIMRIYPGETLASLLYRIQIRLGVSDAEFAKWRPARMYFHTKPCVMLDETTCTSALSPTSSRDSRFASALSSPVSKYGPQPLPNQDGMDVDQKAGLSVVVPSGMAGSNGDQLDGSTDEPTPFYESVLFDNPLLFPPGCLEGVESMPVEIGLRHVDRSARSNVHSQYRDMQGGLTIRSS